MRALCWKGKGNDVFSVRQVLTRRVQHPRAASSRSPPANCRIDLHLLMATTNDGAQRYLGHENWRGDRGGMTVILRIGRRASSSHSVAGNVVCTKGRSRVTKRTNPKRAMAIKGDGPTPCRASCSQQHAGGTTAAARLEYFACRWPMSGPYRSRGQRAGMGRRYSYKTFSNRLHGAPRTRPDRGSVTRVVDFGAAERSASYASSGRR